MLCTPPPLLLFYFQGVLGGLYLLLEEVGGNPFKEFKEFGKKIVLTALNRVRYT